MAKPRYVGTSRSRKHYEVACQGGPWSGRTAVFPQQPSEAYGDDPWSLPIRVDAHTGRYNLNTGVWQALEQLGETA